MSATTGPVFVEHLTIRGETNATPEVSRTELRQRLSTLLRQPLIAVTGSRAATEYGMTVAASLGEEIATRGATLLSGDGLGIETSAIRGALAAGGRVVVLVARGMSATAGYLNANAELFDDVERNGGLVVSPFRDDQLLSRTLFNERLDILGALAGAFVVVESSPRSETMRVAASRAANGDRVFAVPGPITSFVSEGPHELLREGTARLATELTDLGDLAALIGRALVEGDPLDPPRWATHLYGARVDPAADGQAQPWTPTPCDCTTPWKHGQYLTPFDGPMPAASA